MNYQNSLMYSSLIAFCFWAFSACTFQSSNAQQANIMTNANLNANTDNPTDSLETITLGAGCFWCVEAVFQRVEGVHSVVSGYMGGQVKNPTYKEICTGLTGHAEVCQLTFDPKVVSLVDVLEVFWGTHDPTTLNRQGNDVGTQYRSAIFYHTEQQRQVAETYKTKLDASGVFKKPVVTEITPASIFYVAEDYHQNYYNNNPNQGYCAYIITPKLKKFKEVFGDKAKAQ
jgi:peptide-methionine (S)-S-oxide reductase